VPQIDTLKIKGRGEKSLNDFIAWVKQTYPQVTTIKVVDTLEDVVRDADLVTYCSSGEVGDPSNYPIVKREWVKPGAFMAMPASCSLDEGMESSEVRKVLDNTGLYEAWFEELPKPAHHCVPVIGVRFMDMIAEGKMQRDELEDIGKIVAGDAQAAGTMKRSSSCRWAACPWKTWPGARWCIAMTIAKGIGVKLNLWETPALR